MKHSERRMIGGFVAPIVLVYLLIFLYPTVRTVYMSFFKLKNLAAPVSDWEFVGLDNYIKLFSSPLVMQAFSNIIKIAFVGGVGTFIVALFFAVVLSSKVRGKKLLRAIVYLPNLITPVAMVTMWTQYIYNNEYGLLHNLFKALHLNWLADIPWTSTEWAFRSMLIAFCFGSVGYYMVIFMSAMEKIPQDLYDYAGMEGAGKLQMFWRITMPLLKDTTKTAVTFWGIGAVNFFLWSRVFSTNPLEPSTIVPANYMFGMVFGGSSSGASNASMLNVGGGCAMGVLLTLCVVLIFFVVNLICGNEKYEY
ncbi:carbohydrate ABC transporter permease [Allofournierella sp.]|uniref:carbohydrate ABC transporter permease n=1 Tax=Allofournierella sp. TaxID=1940256 RepID=UPI003AB1EAAD